VKAPDPSHLLPPLQAFLLNEDLGDSLDSVEALLKKHEDFEKSLSAQEEKITVRSFLSCHPQSKLSPFLRGLGSSCRALPGLCETSH
jgi:hypothetical protein